MTRILIWMIVLVGVSPVSAAENTEPGSGVGSLDTSTDTTTEIMQFEAPGEAAEDIEPPADETQAETTRTPANDDDAMPEITVIGDRISIDQMDPIMMGRIRDSNGRGAQLYRRGQFAEALPFLLTAARQGFKLAQARVGFIYRQGLGGVERDGEAAIGWLGVAATRTSNPEIIDYFKNLVASIPPAYHPEIDRIVAEYKEKYGSEEVGLHCSNTRRAGTHISRLKCDFENEWDRDAIDMDGLDGLLAVP